jgi:uncharacterized protein (AIM24 family)
MTRIRLGNSTCQIEGNFVPVADFNLDAADSVYFSYRVLLWKDPQVEIRRTQAGDGLTRAMAGLPFTLLDAKGPGHIALSRDEPGETVAIPLHPGQAIDVREHAFLAATTGISYGWHRCHIWFNAGGKLIFPIGQFIDRFCANDRPGLLLLHVGGNVFVRNLAEGETILIRAAALTYKDPSVKMALEIERPANDHWSTHLAIWLRLAGPGRVAVQSAFPTIEFEGRITSTSPKLDNS